MLKHGALEGPPLRVVDDQIGNPTSTDAVADLLLRLIDHPVPGVVHGTCEGEVSWFGFTQAIFALRGLTRGILPCTTAEFPRPAPRPANSRLEKRVLRLARLPTMPGWRETLERFFREHPDL
jgi:dTDP-4-dehydrorhamnose reductase